MKEPCGELYPEAENGDVFCRKKENHKGLHSALVEWGTEGNEEDVPETQIGAY